MIESVALARPVENNHFISMAWGRHMIGPRGEGDS